MARNGGGDSDVSVGVGGCGGGEHNTPCMIATQILSDKINTLIYRSSGHLSIFFERRSHKTELILVYSEGDAPRESTAPSRGRRAEYRPAVPREARRVPLRHPEGGETSTASPPRERRDGYHPAAPREAR